MNERVKMVLSRRHSSVIAKVGAKQILLRTMVLLDVLGIKMDLPDDYLPEDEDAIGGGHGGTQPSASVCG